MLASNIPSKFPIPFAANAGSSYKRTIPQASQVGITAGAASLNDGFPPLTFVAQGAGGIPPAGQDFNEILNWSTSWDQWFSAGAPVYFDATFSAAIGGYPQGAVLSAANTIGKFWISEVDNNTSNPDQGGANWIGYNPTQFSSITSIYNALPPSAFGWQVFTSSGTYTPSSIEVKTALVFATAGGGAGGNSNGGTELTGLGGGAGATAIALVSMVGVTSVAVVIGAGGQPTSASAGRGSYGGAGGTTSFGSYAVAGGGQPGANSTSCGGGGVGGTVSAGLIQSGGNPGEGASGDQSGQRGATGGASFWGGAGLGSDANQPDGVTTAAVAGGNGTAPGAGGGGADSGLISAVPGGAGANGVVLVLEFA